MYLILTEVIDYEARDCSREVDQRRGFGGFFLEDIQRVRCDADGGDQLWHRE